jgi:hypothetical protein
LNLPFPIYKLTLFPCSSLIFWHFSLNLSSLIIQTLLFQLYIHDHWRISLINSSVNNLSYYSRISFWNFQYSSNNLSSWWFKFYFSNNLYENSYFFTFERNIWCIRYIQISISCWMRRKTFLKTFLYIQSSSIVNSNSDINFPINWKTIC